MNDDAALATAWLQGLAARGIATQLVNGRIRHFPASAYKQLTDDEVVFLRHYRAQIREVLRAGIALDVRAAGLPVKAPEEPTPAPAPEPVYCSYCMRAPCIGREHAMFDILHADDPAEYWRRREALREKENAEYEMRRRYGLRPYEW